MLTVSRVSAASLRQIEPRLLHHVEPGGRGAGEPEQADAEAVLPAVLGLLDQAVALQRGDQPERRGLVHVEARRPARSRPARRTRARVSRMLSARSTDCTPRRRPPGCSWRNRRAPWRDSAAQRKTTVRCPFRSTRDSACQRTARESTCASTSRPAATSWSCSQAVVDPQHVLLDDRALVEVGGDVVGGRADQLDAALERLVVGLGALEARQERVVDVDDPRPTSAGTGRR